MNFSKNINFTINNKLLSINNVFIYIIELIFVINIK